MSALSRKNIWEKTPPGIKRAMRWFLGRIPPNLLLGSAYRRAHAFVRETEHWEEEQIRAYQLNQLQKIIKTAFQGSAFYHHQFAEVGFHPGDFKTLDDLRNLPLIDKNTICDNRDTMCTRNPHSSGIDYVSTGGSSGRPLGFYIGSDRSPTEYAYLVAGWERVGYQTQMPQAVIRGQVIKPDRFGLRHEYDPVLRRHGYSNFHMTEDNMARYLAHIATLGPCFLHVYPSSITALARHLRRAGTDAPDNIQGILAGSEIVYDADREAVQETFKTRYFSWYGHSEKLVLATECEGSTRYHVWPTYGYMELVDEDGQPVTAPGGRGEIVGTGFINTVMPFIRYRTGDYATLVGTGCPECGRNHVLLTDIQGHRTQEMLIASDGSSICWTAVNMHDRTFDAVRQFQFRQETPGHATLRIIPTEAFGPDSEARIRKNLDRKLGDRITFDLELCDAIELTGRGKSTFVDQCIAGVTTAEVTIP